MGPLHSLFLISLLPNPSFSKRKPRPITAMIISDPNAIRLANVPRSWKTNVIVPYKSGPIIEDTFPENANSPKNWPLFSSGVNSIIYVRDVTHIDPSEMPNILPAIQNQRAVWAKTAINKATKSRIPTYVTAIRDPFDCVMYPNRNDPAILDTVDTK